MAILLVAFAIIPNPHLNQVLEPVAHLKTLAAEKHLPGQSLMLPRWVLKPETQPGLEDKTLVVFGHLPAKTKSRGLGDKLLLPKSSIHWQLMARQLLRCKELTQATYSVTLSPGSWSEWGKMACLLTLIGKAVLSGSILATLPAGHPPSTTGAILSGST